MGNQEAFGPGKGVYTEPRAGGLSDSHWGCYWHGQNCRDQSRSKRGLIQWSNETGVVGCCTKRRSVNADPTGELNGFLFKTIIVQLVFLSMHRHCQRFYDYVLGDSDS